MSAAAMPPPQEAAPGPAAPLDLAHATLDRGDVAEALRAYLGVLACDPRCPEARAGLGTCLLALGEGGLEVLRLAEASRRAPVPEVLAELACALLHAGNREGARRLLECVLAMVPGDPRARHALDCLAPRRDGEAS